MRIQRNLAWYLAEQIALFTRRYVRATTLSFVGFRLMQKLLCLQSWAIVKKNLHRECVTIRHVESGKYLASWKGQVSLVDRIRPDTCLFEVWKRPKNDLVGLRNKFTGRWLGQSMFGSLVCSAWSFGVREEWQIDDGGEDETTRLLCASAGWGNGGYVSVGKDGAMEILGLEDGKDADLWQLVTQTRSRIR
mmetsp:Transcript_17197/g.39861  ORF Transcript_17197/g.39861 Transcript_17197/m.39861 type:complete len:191 (-) Transcript_17197:974-1546(-)